MEATQLDSSPEYPVGEPILLAVLLHHVVMIAMWAEIATQRMDEVLRSGLESSLPDEQSID